MSRTRVSLGDWPRLTRFFGFSPEQLADMPNNILEMYADALPRLQAEELLDRILVADMPHAEESERRRIFRLLKRDAEVEDTEEKIDHRTEGGRAQAAALGIKIDIPAEVVDSKEDDA